VSFCVVIPARAASSRLPDKPLLDIAGLPMVVRTANQARLSKASQVIIATDDERIRQTVRAHGHDVLMTDAQHASGTDRLAQVAQMLELADDAVLVNVQGDEPLIAPESINTVAALLAQRPDAALATCATPIRDAHTLFNPNAVKVVCDRQQRALYFSRAPIPWARDAFAGAVAGHPPAVLPPDLPALHHIGLYAYRAGFLAQFARLPKGVLEQCESLEQLRALENGYTIIVATLASLPHQGVDTEADLARVRQWLQTTQTPAPSSPSPAPPSHQDVL